jgi:hypothetical protein
VVGSAAAPLTAAASSSSSPSTRSSRPVPAAVSGGGSTSAGSSSSGSSSSRAEERLLQQASTGSGAGAAAAAAAAADADEGEGEGEEEEEEEEEEGEEAAGADSRGSTDILDLLRYESVRFGRLVLLQDQLGRVLGADRELLQLPDTSYISLRQLQIEVEKLMLLMGQFGEKLGLRDIGELLLYDATFSVEPPKEGDASAGALGLQLPGPGSGGDEGSLGEQGAAAQDEGSPGASAPSPLCCAAACGTQGAAACSSTPCGRPTLAPGACQARQRPCGLRRLAQPPCRDTAAGRRLALAGSLGSLSSLEDSGSDSDDDDDGEGSEEGLSFLLMRRSYGSGGAAAAAGGARGSAPAPRSGGVWLGGPPAKASAGGSEAGSSSGGGDGPFPSDFTVSFSLSSYHDVMEDNEVREFKGLAPRWVGPPPRAPWPAPPPRRRVQPGPRRARCRGVPLPRLRRPAQDVRRLEGPAARLLPGAQLGAAWRRRATAQVKV